MSCHVMCDLNVFEIARGCVGWIDWYNWIMLDVNIDCMCDYLFFFVPCQYVMYYCTALSAVIHWICDL